MPTLGYEWQDFGSYRLQYGAGDITFTVSAILVEQDIANNRSKVRREWWYVVHNGGWIASSDTQHYLTGNGWTESAYWNSGTSDTYVVLLDRTDWISHNDDGTGSFSCWGATYLGGIGQETGWVGQDGISLPTIARASVPTASPNPITITTGTNTLTVNTNRKTSVFTHTVRADVWSFQQTKTGVGESTTFNIPYSVIGSIPNNVLQAEGTIYVKTYNGSTQIGDEKNCKFTLKVNTSHDHPNVGTITVEDTNTKTSAVLSSGQFAYGISTLKATIPLTVSGSYTELASATVKCGTKTQTYSLSGTSQTITFTYANINASSLTVTVKDKRGTTASKTKSWTLLPYQPVTATASVRRPSATGSTVVGQVSGVCYGGTYGSTANSLTIKVTSKLRSASSYGNTETYTQSISGTGQTNYTRALTLSHSFDYSQEYDIKFEVSDLFSTATYTCRLTQGLPIMSWDETEVDVWGDLHIHRRTSPTIYQNVLDGFDAILAHSGDKNLLICTSTAQSVRGVQFSFDGWKRVTATGTATGGNAYINYGSFTCQNGRRYIFSGCPANGSSNTYYLQVQDSSGTVVGNDYGNGVEIACVYRQTYKVFVIIKDGATVDGVQFSPMVRDNRLASDVFLPSGQGIHVYTNTSTSASTTGDFTAEFQKTAVGAGFLIVSISCISDTYNSYGSQSAKIYVNGTLVSASASRYPTNVTAEMGESTVACVAVKHGDIIKATATITKYGNRTAYFSCMAFGCVLN